MRVIAKPRIRTASGGGAGLLLAALAAGCIEPQAHAPLPPDHPAALEAAESTRPAPSTTLALPGDTAVEHADPPAVDPHPPAPRPMEGPHGRSGHGGSR